MGIGKLYKSNSEFLVDVNYHFYGESQAGWWGELVPTEYKRLGEGEGYVLEFEDGRKGRCSLKKRINRAVNGPPRSTTIILGGRASLNKDTGVARW